MNAPQTTHAEGGEVAKGLILHALCPVHASALAVQGQMDSSLSIRHKSSNGPDTALASPMM